MRFNNVSFTSDVKISAWRSSSTHWSNRIVCAACKHGSTQWVFRPRFKTRLGTTVGSTNFLRLNTSEYGLAMMEFANEPLVVRMSSHYTKTGVTCNLTVYMEN